MEGLPHVPKSVPNFRRSSPISPSSTRLLRQIVDTRDTSKLINLSATVRNIKPLKHSDLFDLSFQMSSLRKTIDKYSVLSIHKESRLQTLQLRLKELSENSISKKEDIQKALQYKSLKYKLQETEQSESDELFTQSVLNFMHDRLLSTKKFLLKKEVKLKRSLEKLNLELESIHKKRKNTVDSLTQYRSVYKEALGQYNYDKNSLIEEKTRLESHSNNRKRILQKTEDHNKHRLDIIELTMIEESSSHLDELRNSQLVHKCFEMFLNKKIISEKIKFEKLDLAFQKIKLRTGLQTIDDVIERFLTKETSLKELTENIHEKEEQVNDFHDKIISLQKKVNILQNDKCEKAQDGNITRIIEENSKLKTKKTHLEGRIVEIENWVRLNTDKVRMGKSKEIDETSGLKERFLLLKNLVSEIVKEYAATGKVKDNEDKRKKMKIDDIINRIRKK